VLSIVLNTVGVSTVEELTGVDVLGYYLSDSAEAVLVWIVTAGRLMRVEVTGSAALAITFPLERVSRVAELYAPDGYVVTVEVDADARATDGDRSVFTQYPVLASQPQDTAALQSFSRALRLCIGV
jgi:hypothetical protein